MEKLIVNKVEVEKCSFELRRVYNVKRFMKEIKGRLKQIPADYIEFSCDTNDASEVCITFYTGRKETNREFGDRMLHDQIDEYAKKAREENAEFWKNLTLKAKFENK